MPVNSVEFVVVSGLGENSTEAGKSAPRATIIPRQGMKLLGREGTQMRRRRLTQL